MMKTKLLCTALLCFLLSQHAMGQQNLLTVNPGFENGRIGWYFDASGTILPEAAHEGKAGIKLVTPQGSGPKWIFTKPEEQKLTLDGTRNYRLDIWVKPLTKTWGLKLWVYGTAGFVAGTDQELDINGKKLKLNEWQLVSFDIKGANYANAKFSFGNGLGEILADDFKLYEVQ